MMDDSGSENSFHINYTIEIQDLKRQLQLERINTSNAIKDIIEFCKKEESEDPMLNQTTENTFRTSSKRLLF